MNSIEVSRLEEGQRFSAPVFITDEHLFVPAEAQIRKKDLDLLKKLNITEVLTDGILLIDLTPPGAPSAATAGNELAETGEAADGALSAMQDDTETHQKINLIVKQLDKIFLEIGSSEIAGKNKNISVRQLWVITSKILQLIKEDRTHCLSYILSGNIQDFELAKSSVIACILSVLIAEELKVNVQKTTDIAVGALLHDVGMLRLPLEVVKKQGGLTQEEIQIIRRHTAISYQIITKELAYSPEVAIIALQHHERWDGSGYPHRLVGNAIDAGARIVSVADAFEAMICEKPYRDSMMAYMAMKNLVAENAAHFAPNMLKAFVKIMGVYPIGSGVALNDGRIARIMQVRPETPMRPLVKIIARQGAQKVKDGEIIDLLNQKHLFITQVLDIRNF